ncbi:MAG: RnfABCDGE type electron transport complex subunit D [SAR324 cluster bacterium]|nr:RnfABCDGE type electron transport complex subunit D [SAR324 cluster bacterium]
MMSSKNKIILSTAPFLRQGETTPWIMFQVVFSLIPVFLAAFYFFGLSVLLVTVTAIASCLLTEWFFDTNRPRGISLKDGSTLLTGMLFALTLPPGLPLWMVFLGGIAAIGMGKVIWGGLGQNIFNPALIGRAFLQAAFPIAITTWSSPTGNYFIPRGTNLAWPFMQGEALDTITTATPLALMKFQHQSTGILNLLLGNTGGSLGETSSIVIILAGIYLAAKKVINWQIPAAILLTVILFSGILYSFAPDRYPSPVFMVLSGGLLLGTVFMATDPVTSPITTRGCWVFGCGIGLLVVLIRVFGGLPEGVMYAILLMNAVTPLINRITREKIYGA